MLALLFFVVFALGWATGFFLRPVIWPSPALKMNVVLKEPQLTYEQAMQRKHTGCVRAGFHSALITCATCDPRRLRA